VPGVWHLDPHPGQGGKTMTDNRSWKNATEAVEEMKRVVAEQGRPAIVTVQKGPLPDPDLAPLRFTATVLKQRDTSPRPFRFDIDWNAMKVPTDDV